MKQKYDARFIALNILNKLEKKNLSLDFILDENKKRDFLSPKDKSLLNNLVYGVLRNKSNIDHIISFFSKTPVEKIKKEVLNILRIASFQIIYLDKVPNFAAVNTAVNLVKQFGFKNLSPYVNAVLRNITRNYKNVKYPDNKLENLAIKNSFPLWLAEKYLGEYSYENIEKTALFINEIPDITACLNTLKTTKKDLINSLEKQAKEIRSDLNSPFAVSFKKSNKAVFELDAFKKGFFHIQDDIAQLICLFLNPQKQEKVLDACSGFGGKAFLLAELMENTGSICCADIKDHKLKKLEKEAKRLFISNIKTIKCDLEKKNTLNINNFDKIFIDAPCSGLGVLRKNPDAKWKKVNFQDYQTKQIKILENAAMLLKKGGYLVYCVCSTEEEETLYVINHFLKNNKNFIIDSDLKNLHQSISKFINEKHYFISAPHIHRTDAFFAAKIKKI